MARAIALTGMSACWPGALAGWPSNLAPRARRGSAWFLLVASAAFCAAVVASSGRGPEVEPSERALVVAPRAAAQSVLSNGVVESIRELPDAADGRTRRFQMTIRMRDGTLRVSDETGQAHWQPGDGVRLFAQTPALP